MSPTAACTGRQAGRQAVSVTQCAPPLRHDRRRLLLFHHRSPSALAFLHLNVRRTHVVEDALNQVRCPAALLGSTALVWSGSMQASARLLSHAASIAMLQLVYRAEDLKKPLRVTFISGGVPEPAQVRARGVAQPCVRVWRGLQQRPAALFHSHLFCCPRCLLPARTRAASPRSSSCCWSATCSSQRWLAGRPTGRRCRLM